MSDVSLGTRQQYSLVVDVDIKKQKKKILTIHANDNIRIFIRSNEKKSDESRHISNSLKIEGKKVLTKKQAILIYKFENEKFLSLRVKKEVFKDGEHIEMMLKKYNCLVTVPV